MRKKKKAEQKEQQWKYIQTNNGATVGISPKSLLFSKSGFFKAITKGRFEKKGIADNPIILKSINKTQLKLIHRYIVNKKTPKKLFERYLQDCNINNLNQLIVTGNFLDVKGIFKFVVPCLIKKLQNPNVLNNWLKAGWSKLLTENEKLSDYIKQYLKRNITPTPQYLRRNKPKLSNILVGHNAEISLVKPSFDCTMIASGDCDGIVKIWNAKTGNEMNTIRTGTTDDVESIVFSSDRKMLVSRSEYYASKFWNIQNGTEITVNKNKYSACYSVAFHPNGTMLVLGLKCGTIEFCTTETGIKTHTIMGYTGSVMGHTGSVLTLAFNQNGTIILASGSRDKTVKIWNVETGIKICTLTGHEYHVSSVVFRPDGKMLASTQFLGKIKFWNVKTGTEILTFPKNIKLIAFSPDSTMLAFVSYDSKVKFLNIKTGNEICTFNENTFCLNSIAFNPDSRMFVLGSRDHTIRIFRLINLQNQDIQQLSTLDLLLISARQSFEITDLKQTYPELYKIYNQSSDPAKALMTQAKKRCWFSWRKVNNIIRHFYHIVHPFLQVSVVVAMFYFIYAIIYKMDKKTTFIFLQLYLQLIRILI